MATSKTLEYDICIAKKVSKSGDFYEVTRDDGWTFRLDSRHGIEPKEGDTLEMYGGIGHQIRGVCVNGKTAFFKGQAQIDAEHEKWRLETRARYAKEYSEYMEKIKDDPARETVDVSGMGGAYEHACQKMIEAGEAYLHKNPEFEFDHKEFKNVYGVCWSDSPQAKELDKALMKSVDGDSSGAMHQCVIGHLAFIHKNGRDAWLREFEKDRTYVLPLGLPAPSF